MKILNRIGSNIEPWGTIYWPPIRLCSTDHHTLDVVVQPVFNSFRNLWEPCLWCQRKQNDVPNLWRSLWGKIMTSQNDRELEETVSYTGGWERKMCNGQLNLTWYWVVLSSGYWYCYNTLTLLSTCLLTYFILIKCLAKDFNLSNPMSNKTR